MKETQAQCEMLVAQHRRARMAGKAVKAMDNGKGTVIKGSTLGRFKAQIQNAEADNHAGRTLLEGDSLEDKFQRLERDGKVEQLLEELKQKLGRMLEAG